MSHPDPVPVATVDPPAAAATTVADNWPAPAADHRHPYAWTPVLAVAGAVAVVLALTSNRYGFFGDELYFLAAGRRLDWGYADQPPLLPLLAAAAKTLSGGSLVGLRLLPLLLTVLAVLVTAQLARELGGDRRAQVLAAAAYPTSTLLLSTGHLLYTATVDVPLWAVATWLLVRWVRLRRDGLLLWLGVVTAVALQTRYLFVGFAALALLAVAAVGPRELLRRRALWGGAAIALGSTVPGLCWQAAHDWPQLRMLGVLSADNGAAGRLLFLPLGLATAGLLVGSVLVCYGQWRLLRAEELRPYRFLGWTSLGLLGLFLAGNGRPYYLAGMFPLLWAVAATQLRRHRPAGWWRWIPTWPAYVLSALYALTALPVFPVSWHEKSIDPVTSGSLGWPELADTVAGAYWQLPADQRSTAVVVTQSYWQAAALEWYGPDRGLPPVYSGNRGYAYFGAPADDSGVVLWVGLSPDPMRPYFGSMSQVATSPSLGVTHTVWICRDRTRPWTRIWPEYRDL